MPRSNGTLPRNPRERRRVRHLRNMRRSTAERKSDEVTTLAMIDWKPGDGR